MPTWYVLLDGPPEDVAHVKRLFTTSGFTFDHMDGKDTLSVPAFELRKDSKEVIDAAMELLASINTTLRISLPQYTGLQFHGLVEKKENGALNRTMLMQAVAYATNTGTAVLSGGSVGKPIRSKEERLVSLIDKNLAVEDVADRLSTRPLTWATMSMAYESVIGLMSNKSDPGARRSDYGGLIARGWLTADEADGFYNTAAYQRKGYPKTPVRRVPPMEYYVAYSLTFRLFWRLVDELEPT